MFETQIIVFQIKKYKVCPKLLRFVLRIKFLQVIMDNKAFFKLSYGLFVVTAREDGKDNGCITNTVMQLTTTPNRISLAVNKANYTHGMIERTGRFNVSILSESSTFDTFKHWGFQSGKDVDKAVGITFSRSDNGIIYVTEGVNAVLSAKVESMVDLGTHTLFIAEVTDAESLNDTPSATYSYYHSNIKPKPQASSGTSENGKTVWVCTICGYEYEGDEIPDDFICPLCTHPASDFEKVVR